MVIQIDFFITCSPTKILTKIFEISPRPWRGSPLAAYPSPLPSGGEGGGEGAYFINVRDKFSDFIV